MTNSINQDNPNQDNPNQDSVQQAFDVEAQDALRLSETRYRRLFEAARDGILILDAESCKITDANPFMVELLGYPREEFLGKELFEIGLLKDAAASHAMYRELQETGYIRYDDLPLLAKEGRQHDVEVVSNVYAENGHRVIQCNIRDITQRKQAEAQHRVSEESLRAAQEIAHLGSWEWGLTPGDEWGDSAVRWSDETFRILGYEPGEVEASYDNLMRVVHPDDRSRIEAPSPRALQERKSYSVDHRLLLPDGTERVVHWLSDCVFDASGKPLKVFGTVQDITERKHAEAASAHLAAIVESSEDAIITKTLDGIVTTWNAGAQRLYGYTAEEMIGHPVSLLVPADRPDEIPQLLQKVRRGETVEHYETVRVRKDGSLFDISLSISPLKDTEGHIIGASAIKRDITERKLAEKQLRLHSHLLNVVGQAVIVTDPAGTITYWNDFAEKLYGWPASEALGRSILEVTPTDTTREQATEIMAHLRRGQSWSGEFLSQRRDGTTFPAYVTDTPVRDAAGRVSSIIGLSLDISERKQAEAALQQERDFIAAVVDTVGNLVVVLDRQARIVRFNHACEQLTGYSCDEVVGQSVYKLLLAPDELEGIAAVFADLLAGQFPNTYENAWITKNGSRRLIAWSNTALLDAEGAVEFIIGTGTDITEREQTQAALLEAQRFAQATVDALPDNIAVVDEQGEIIAVNAPWRAFAAANGFIGADAAVGANYLRACAISDTEESRAVAAGIRAVIGGNRELFSLEYPCHSPVEERWFEMRVTRFGGSKPRHIVVAHENVTSRKRAEAEKAQIQAQMEEQRLRLNTIVATVPGVVWETWAKPDSLRPGSMQHADFTSDYVETMLGYTAAEWVAIPNFWFAIVHPDDKEYTAREVAAIFAGGRGGTSRFRWIAKDGHVVWVESQMVVVCDETGCAIGMRGVTMDISERKQAEEVLQRQQSELQVLFDLMPAMIWFKDDKNGILRVNKRVAEAAGKSVEEIEGKPSLEIYPHEAAKFYADDLEVIQSGVPRLGIVETLQDTQGRQLWVETDKVPVFDKDGKVTGIIVMAQDITERKQAEELLMESRQRLALATEAAHVGIWDWDVVTNKLIWDDQMYALYGLGKHEFSGAYDAWQNGLHPEDRESAHADMNAALDGSRDFHPQFRVVWPGGVVRHIEAHAVVVRASDSTAHRVIGVNWDITERKEAEAALRRLRDELEIRVQRRTAELEQVNAALREEEIKQQQIMATLEQSEERFRLLVEKVHDYAILMLDTTGHIMTWNVGAQRIKGYQAEEIIGRHFSCFYTDEDQQAGKPERELEIAALQGYCDDEGWRVRQDGSQFWATVVLTALRDDAGQLRGFAKVSRDITERKNIEAALRAAKTQADAANLAKSDFLSRMSHELRTPLNAILGFGQILEMNHPLEATDATGTDGEAVEHILKGGRHLLGLINEVLDIASIEAGRSTLSLEPIPVNQTVREVLDMVRPLAATRHIHIVNRITNQVPSHDDLHVFADLQRFRQILLNLLANAIKYNREGGQVDISCAASGESLRLMVSDTGAGLTKEEIGKLFVPFERLGAGGSQIEGTGLGLALCKTLVEAMEGRIGVDSTPGQGSTFWVEFPLVESQSAQLEQNPEHFAGAGNLEESISVPVQHTVLYIEDNLSNLRVVEILLNGRPGISLLSAMQGSIGLDLARQHIPDLILLDLHLPDIPGDEVLRRLRTNPATSEIPVVVLSADATPGQIAKLRAAGIKHYLTKPLNLREFLQVLDETLKSITPPSITLS